MALPRGTFNVHGPQVDPEFVRLIKFARASRESQMQFSFMAVLSALWKHKRFIILLTLFAAIAGAARILVSDREYQAEKSLVVTSIDLAPRVGDADALSLNSSIPAPLSPKVYADLLMSPNLLGQVYTALLNSNAISTKEYPRLSDFTSTVSAGITVVDQTARPVLYSPIIVLSARGGKPEQLKSIVEKWAVVGMEWSRSIGDITTASAAAQFVKNRERFATDLESLQNALAEEKGKWNVDILKKDLEERQKLMGEVEKAQSDSERELSGGEETLRAIREAKTGEPEKLQLFRSPSDDAYFIGQAVGQAKAAAGADKKGMVDEQFNQNYIEMESLETKTLGDVSSARAKLETAKQQIEALRTKQNEQGALVAVHEQTQKRMEANVKAGLDTYGQIAAAERVLSAVQSLAAATDEKGVTPLGLNQLHEDVSPIVSRGLMGQNRKYYLMLVVFLSFIVASLYAVIIDIVVPALRAAAASGR